MEPAEFDDMIRALLRLARPQDLINAEGDLIDLHDAGFWLWRYAQLMQAFHGQPSPPPARDAAAFHDLRQATKMALQVIAALQRRQARMPLPRQAHGEEA